MDQRWWTHDDSCIYMLFDYVCGGELFSYLRNAGRFSNSIGTLCGTEDVKRHRWFKHIDWADVFMKKLQPPIIPAVSYEGDTSNFDEYPETDWKAVRSLDSDELKLFANF
ncbi:hypothetical protein HW555_007577 [Spodoptera exigua]|uniref:AGC-kinase C-terminal domain-containing protein n=1 Tax=Spodoptera exigua TaxID=7107 RepID=A0A835L4A6_SPOEX|nr:hypothetical protein HW555_007577 [Spodoptera exigua]